MTLWRIYLTAFLSISFAYRLTRLILAVRRAHRNGRGRVAARPIFWVMTGGYLVLLGIAATEGFAQAAPTAWSVSFLGLSLYACALWLREKAMRDLGRHFSPDIEIRSGHRVVREGFYAYVRHPLLACLMLEVAGLQCLFNAFEPSGLIALAGYFALIIIRQRLEERMLLHEMGGAYRAYQGDVGAFLPRWQAFIGEGRKVTHA